MIRSFRHKGLQAFYDYAVKVTANWRLTFVFEAGDAVLVDYQDYH